MLGTRPSVGHVSSSADWHIWSDPSLHRLCVSRLLYIPRRRSPLREVWWRCKVRTASRLPTCIWRQAIVRAIPQHYLMSFVADFEANASLFESLVETLLATASPTSCNIVSFGAIWQRHDFS